MIEDIKTQIVTDCRKLKLSSFRSAYRGKVISKGSYKACLLSLPEKECLNNQSAQKRIYAFAWPIRLFAYGHLPSPGGDKYAPVQLKSFVVKRLGCEVFHFLRPACMALKRHLSVPVTGAGTGWTYGFTARMIKPYF